VSIKTWAYVAVAVVVVLVLWGAVRIGQSLGAGECAQANLDVANATLDFAGAAAAIETKRAATVAAKNDRVQTRARAVKNEHPIEPAGCRLSEPERLRLDALYDTYWPTTAGQLPDRVPATATPNDGHGGIPGD